jgi:hypothetical protein
MNVNLRLKLRLDWGFSRISIPFPADERPFPFPPLFKLGGIYSLSQKDEV